MVALSAGFATRAFFDPSELLEAAVKRFLLPARARGSFHQLLDAGRGKVIGHDPFHVVVWNHRFDLAHRKGLLRAAHFQPRAPLARRRFQRFKRLLPHVLTRPHQPVAY